MKTTKFFSVLLLIALCASLFIGCITLPEENSTPDPQPDTSTTTKPDDPVVKPDDPVVKPDDPVVKPDDPVVKPDDTKVEIKRASRIHILNSQTLQHEYNETSGDTWGLITLANCTYSIVDGMIKISGSIGRSYATVETSIQNVLIVY